MSLGLQDRRPKKNVFPEKTGPPPPGAAQHTTAESLMLAATLLGMADTTDLWLGTLCDLEGALRALTTKPAHQGMQLREKGRMRGWIEVISNDLSARMFYGCLFSMKVPAEGQWPGLGFR